MAQKKTEGKKGGKPAKKKAEDKKAAKKPEDKKAAKKPEKGGKVKKAEKPAAKKEEKANGGRGKEEKKQPSYRVKRTPEAMKMAREKSRLEKRKAKFKRQNFGKIKRVPDRWRRPTGIDSGHLIDEKSKPGHPRAGYITPSRVRGLHPSGFRPVRVFNPDGLTGIDPKTEAILIASSVGKRKRREIQQLANDKCIQVLNYKEI